MFLELPTVLNAKQISLFVNLANAIAPDTSEGFEFVNDDGNDVPIPFVIVVAVTAVKLPTDELWEFVKLNAVVPVKLYPDG